MAVTTTTKAANIRQFTRPIMGRGARLYADQARWQRFEERHHLTAPQLLPNNNLVAAVDPVNLEYVLRAISKPIVLICMWTAPLM